MKFFKHDSEARLTRENFLVLRHPIFFHCDSFTMRYELLIQIARTTILYLFFEIGEVHVNRSANGQAKANRTDIEQRR